MAGVRSRIGAVPALGGLALALTVLATMIGGVVAQPPPPGSTVCNRCWNNAWARASAPKSATNPTPICPDDQYPGQLKHGCIYNYALATCYGGDTPICPDPNEAPATVSCAGEEYVVCPNEALGPCNWATWNVNCEANTTKRCDDKQVFDDDVLPSHCYVTCSCLVP